MRDERYGRIGNELSLLRARGSMYVCVDRIGLHRWNSAHVGTKLNSTHWRTNTDMISIGCVMSVTDVSETSFHVFLLSFMIGWF